MSRKVIITGGLGFIGKALCLHLHDAGYEIYVLSRSGGSEAETIDGMYKIIGWDGKTGEGWLKYADEALAVVNLAGDNIASGIWTTRKKQRIIDSRVNAAKAIMDVLKRVNEKPKVVIQASGVGYYGDGGDKILDESANAGTGFLVEVAKQWEQSIQPVTELGVRLAIARLGIVMGKGGGFLQRVTMPFRLFLGGHLGSGEQWMSWVHIADVAGAIRFLIENENCKGVYNVTAPGPLKSKRFFQILGKVMQRPSFFSVPGFVLKTFLGQMAEEMILMGQRAMPKKLVQSEYHFLFPSLEDALKNILTGKS